MVTPEEEEAINAGHSAAVGAFIDAYMKHVDNRSLALLRWTQSARGGASAWGLEVSNGDDDRDRPVQGG